jgi:hypothetical protein
MRKSSVFAGIIICFCAAGIVWAGGEPRKAIPKSLKKYAQPYVITSSGSYYLAGNRLCDTNGIIVEANDVMIDLRGFTLLGNHNGSGIYMTAKNNVEISNGTISDFNYGVYDEYVSPSASTGHRIIGVRALSNTQGGIFLGGTRCVVRDCFVSGNGASNSGTTYGIYAYSASTITANTVCDNGSSGANVYGIYTASSSILTGNTVLGNGSSSSGDVYAIHTGGASCIINGNTVYNNGTSAAGIVRGIHASNGSTVTGNSAYLNGNGSGGGTTGIYISTGCTVIANTVYYNGAGGSGTIYGIYLGGNDFVNQNTVYDNDGTNMNAPVNCTFGDNHAP